MPTIRCLGMYRQTNMMKRPNCIRRSFRMTAAAAAASAAIVTNNIASGGRSGGGVAEAFCAGPTIAVHQYQQRSARRRVLPLPAADDHGDGSNNTKRRPRSSRCSSSGRRLHMSYCDTAESGGSASSVCDAWTVQAAGIHVLASGGGGSRSSVRRRERGTAPSRTRPRAMTPLRAVDQPFDVPAAGGGGRVEGPSTASAEARRPRVEGEASRGKRRTPFGHITDETLDLIRASTSITEVISQ